MAEKFNLQAELICEEGIKAGEGQQDKNKITLKIKNLGDDTRKPINLVLTGTLGISSKALFLDKEDAQSCEIEKPGDWRVAAGIFDENNNTFSFKINKPGGIDFAKSSSITIIFSNIISRTNPDGPAEIIFTGKSIEPAQQKFNINKSSEEPGIVYFTSTPKDEVLNLPGDLVTLQWRTSKLDRWVLKEGYITLKEGTGEEGTHSLKADTVGKTYVLKGLTGDNEWFQSKLDVKVLSLGWHDRVQTVFEGDPGYPIEEDDSHDSLPASVTLKPTLLVNANDDHLYAIFQRELDEKTKDYFLFQTKNPFGPWQYLDSKVEGQPGQSVPKGFATSPGVYFKEKLWLIGGNQIDPEITSNEVWSYDLKSKQFVSHGVAPWDSRMGHAVIVFMGKIWMLGGRDEVGNALNEIWSFDGNETWKKESKGSWAPRCLFQPVIFKDPVSRKEQLWLFGGAKAPFSETLFHDLWVFDGTGWKQNEISTNISKNGDRRPISSALQVLNGKLYLFGHFSERFEGDTITVEPLAYRLENFRRKTWVVLDGSKLGDWVAYTTFNFQLVNFKDQMLIGNALTSDITNKVLKVYVKLNT